MILPFLCPNLPQRALLFAAMNGLLAVALGAFGAHALEAHLSVAQLATWATAVQYHMFHVAALVGVQVLVDRQGADRALQRGADLFLLGIVLFCGSLYLLALTGLRWLGPLTPLGGLAFLAGWLQLVLCCGRKRSHD